MPDELDYSRIAFLLQKELLHADEPKTWVAPEENPFETLPVDLETFLYDHEYLGLPPLGPRQFEAVRYATNIYPAPIREMLGITDPLYDTLVCLWGKGSGKDFVSRVTICRIVYLLQCLRSPQRTYGMIESDAIDCINMAYSAYQANNIFFKPLVSMLEHSPYFKGKWNRHMNQIQFDKHIVAHSGNSAQESFEGFNPILVVLDELDAFKTEDDLRRHGGWNPEHSAAGILNALRSSAQSRFPGLGKTMLISFLRRPDGFMIQQYNKAAQDPKTFASKGATWEIHPLRTRADFDVDFIRNPEDSAMRYGCIPTATSAHFFRNRDVLYEIFHFDETKDELLSSAPLNPFHAEVGWYGFYSTYKIRQSDLSPRFIHIDTGITNDAASVSCVHLYGTMEQFGVTVPVVQVDFMAVLDPLQLGEVKLDQIRDVVRDFLKCKEGTPFEILVTFDQYQSRDSMQILAGEGVTTGYRSVDKDDSCYVTLKDLIYTRRLLSPGSILAPKELRELVRLPNGKVDHPTGGSKDLADTLAGAVANLYEFYYGDISKVVVYEARQEIGAPSTSTPRPHPGSLPPPGIHIGDY